ncbi:hypothetical protein [Paraurantiacibacter namhicola]|uniref:Uncharacterized protein n=1 Tax=Paraurantiacibacter namhicola TaxID=645517 RepID=A0A1C7D658_9SPHN|nr:hypothetical protein [Paraurantiacibacter namhicola]ANU06832.1 hypothetical protein A6F65_00508 [Paraurantiacibacter namhicola]
MKGKFHCQGCDRALTGEITVQSLKDPSVQTACLIDQRPVCAKGSGFKSYEPLLRSHDPIRPAALEFVPQYWLNPEDFEATGKVTRKRGRTNGCCGLDGCDGPNIECRECGTEIGTKQSDCWTPLIFVPDPDNTEFRKTET